MKYIKADSVLPIALVEELQNYIQGGYIYVPSKRDNKKKWGELSGYKFEIEQRNLKIKKAIKKEKVLMNWLKFIIFLFIQSKKSYIRSDSLEVVILRPHFYIKNTSVGNSILKTLFSDNIM